MLVDTGLLQGWALTRADDDAPFSAATSPVTMTRETEGDVLY
ncbi:hypothetical protein [Pseudonocardia sp. DSM 110487]|nr:hypothetical protein [Pseudonocardia sp. DSM 110487]